MSRTWQFLRFLPSSLPHEGILTSAWSTSATQLGHLSLLCIFQLPCDNGRIWPCSFFLEENINWWLELQLKAGLPTVQTHCFSSSEVLVLKHFTLDLVWAGASWTTSWQLSVGRPVVAVFWNIWWKDFSESFDGTRAKNTFIQHTLDPICYR